MKLEYEIKTENSKEVIYYYQNDSLFTKENYTGIIKDGYKLKGSPNWITFKKAVWHDQALFGKVFSTCSPNAYTTLLKIITDGENGVGDEQDLVNILAISGINWTASDKLTLNGYFEQNNFTIQLT